MKHLLLAALLLRLSPAVLAQSSNPALWCPAGAQWTYSYGLFNEFGTVTVRYQRDTLVAGQPVQLLICQIRSSFWVVFPTVSVPGPAYALPSVVTRVVADRVEVLANGQFYTLYDFAALPGSSWPTAPVTPQGPCPQGLVLVTVDSVGRQQVGGRSLRWFRAHLTAPTGPQNAGDWTGRIYEQLGNVARYMQPQSAGCRGTDPGYMGPMVSYQATGVPVVRYNPATGTLLATAESRAVAAGFTVFPNPSTGLSSVELPAGLGPDAHLTLVDLTGRQVRAFSIGRQLDLRGLPAGAYTLLLSEPHQPALARRVMLE